MKPSKFKEIRKSIIAQKQPHHNDFSPNKSPLRKNLFGQPSDTEMSFKSIKQSAMSPLKQIDFNASQLSTNKKNKFMFEDSAEKRNLSPLSNKKKCQDIQKSKGMYIYDSERKTLNYQRVISNFGSDQKSNEPKSIYFARQNKENSTHEEINQNFGLQFTNNERKLNTNRQNANDPFFRPQTKPNSLYETSKNPTPGSLTKKSSCSMLFKTALETSNKKKTLRNNADSDRSCNARQNSIGKLKEKLFGMRKIISEKQNRPSNQNQISDGEETKSFTIYTTKSSKQEKAQKEKISTISAIRKEITEKSEESGSFSNLVVASVNKGLSKAAFKHFLNIEAPRESKGIGMCLGNDSRIDSVNVSVAESFDSVLDMSPCL